MRTVNVHEAKTQLSRLLAEVERGDEVVIARNGKAIARLVPVDAPRTGRVSGTDRGRIAYADDLHAPLSPELARDFEP